MSKKEAYEQKLQAQLVEWRAGIDKLQAMVDKSSADAKIELNRQISDFQAKQAAAKVKLDELRGASESAWEDLRLGAEKAFNDVSEAFRAAAAKFKL